MKERVPKPVFASDKTKEALVLMPFDGSYDDIYQFGIKYVLEKRGYHCIRIDEKSFHGQVIDEIQRSIVESDVIVAEMTDKNPNVYYEVGYAHGLGKHPILITKQANTLPFDLRGYKHIVYKGEIKTLRSELKSYLKWLDQAPPTTNKIIRDPTKLKIESQFVLIHLYEADEPRPAIECAEMAMGVFTVLTDLRFLGYVRFYGLLLPNTPIHLTEIGKEVAKKLVDPVEYDKLQEEVVRKKCVKLYQAEELFHRFGSQVEDESALNNIAWFADLSTQSSHIIYGPYEILPEPGEYIAFFKIKIDDNSLADFILLLDVSGGSKNARRIRGIEFDKPHKYQLFALKFRLDAIQPMEYRIFNVYKKGKIWIDYIAIVKSSALVMPVGDPLERARVLG